MRSGSGFLAAFLLTVVGGLTLLAALNALGDPYRVLGTPRIRGVNDVQARAPSRWREGTQRYLGALARDSAAGVVLVGSSHVRSGIPTCHRKELLRLTAGALGSDETRALVSAALASARAPRLFLVEVAAVGGPTGEPETETPDLVEALLGVEATDLSLRQLRASLSADRDGSPAPLPPGCTTVPSEKRAPYPFADLDARAAEFVAALAETPTGGARETVEAFLRGCGPREHHLRLFLLPVHDDLLARPRVAEALAETSRRLRDLASSADNDGAGCSVSFVDLTRAAPELRSRPGSWYDPTHFTPALGDTLLSLLLADGEGSQNRS